MTADYNPTEAARLITGMREDDAVLSAAKPACSCLPIVGFPPDAVSVCALVVYRRRIKEAMSRVLGRQEALADLLEASGREVERLVEERDRVVAHGHEALSERDSLRAALVKAKDEHTGDALAWFEREHALTMERDSLRQQLEAAQRSHAEDIQMYRATESDLAHNHRRADAAEADLSAAQRRIAELETSRAEIKEISTPGPDGAHQMIGKMRSLIHEFEQQWAPTYPTHMTEIKQETASVATAAIRAVWPVYRAAVIWSEAFTGTSAFDALETAVVTARAALTPEILAALERAGLECK